MKLPVLSLLLAGLSLVSTAQTAHPRHHAAHHAAHHRSALRPAAFPKVYVCGGGSAYAYHSSDGCAGLNRCSHGLSAVTVGEAEQLGRRPCKKCH